MFENGRSQVEWCKTDMLDSKKQVVVEKGCENSRMAKNGRQCVLTVKNTFENES